MAATVGRCRQIGACQVGPDVKLSWGEGNKFPFIAEWGSQVFYVREKMSCVSDLERVARGWDEEH